MGMLKPWHIIVLVVVILLLFGARRLPDLAKSVGQSLKIFKNEVKDLRDDIPPADQDPPGDTPGASTGGTNLSKGTAPSTPDDTPKA